MLYLSFEVHCFEDEVLVGVDPLGPVVRDTAHVALPKQLEAATITSGYTIYIHKQKC